MQKRFFLGLAVAMLLACADCFAQDWKAFCLNGSVKSIECTDGEIDDGPVPYSEITFTRAGKVSTVDEIPLPMEGAASTYFATRNAKGQLSSYVMYGADGNSESTRYTYNVQGRIATSQSFYNGKAEGKAKTHTYDANGNLAKRGTTVYTILKKDSQGNWLSRKYKNDYGKMVTETRTITYYETTAQTGTKDFSTSDLRMYELKGKVKTMRLYNDVTTSDSWLIGFSQQGKWITADGKQLSATYSKVSRDTKGRVSSTLSGENDAITQNTYTYNAQGYVEKCDTDYGVDGNSKESFTYNTAGELVKSRLVENMGYDEPDQPAVTITYTIITRDNHGNWTQRKVSKSDGTSRIQKRVITYYQ